MKKASLRVQGPDRPYNRSGRPSSRLEVWTTWRFIVKYGRPTVDNDRDVDDDGFIVDFTTSHPTALLTHLEYFIFVSSRALLTIYKNSNINSRVFSTMASDLPMDTAVSTGGRANSLQDVPINGVSTQLRANGTDEQKATYCRSLRGLRLAQG